MLATPEDTFEIAIRGGINPRWKKKRNYLHFWQQFLDAAHGIKLEIDYRIPIDRPDPQDPKLAPPSALQTQLITGIGLMSDDGLVLPVEPDSVDQSNLKNMTHVVALYDNIAVEYRAESNREVFSAHGFKGDLYSERSKEDADYVQNVAMENMRVALILAQNAKLAGWTSVSFGNTTDPAKRLALMVACMEVGLDCTSEKVNRSSLTKSTFYKGKLAETIAGALEDQKKNPMSTINLDNITANTPINAPAP